MPYLVAGVAEQFSFHPHITARIAVRACTLDGALQPGGVMITTTLEQETEREQEKPPRNRETVEQLAYRFWQERGCPDGSPEEDWYRAEKELNG